jgi:hypothetical protein
MDREGLLQNPEISLCLCRVPAGSLQRGDGLTLMVEAALGALNAHLGVLNKVFQVRGPSVSLPANVAAMVAFLRAAPTSTQS